MNPSLPQDASLPQLAQALDAQAMARVFARELDGWQVLACDVDRVKYRPQRNCSVSYRLQLGNPRDGRAMEQQVAARFCRDGESAQRLVKARARDTVPSSVGLSLSHVPSLDMLAFWWPNDAKLGALRLLTDPAALRERCLNDLAATLTDGQGQLLGQQTTLMRWVPEVRVCARVNLRLQRTPNAAITTQTLFAKADAHHSGATTHAVMQALSAGSAQAQGRLHTPRSLQWHEGSGLHWQCAAAGQTLFAVAPTIQASVSTAIGHHLAALHATPVPTPSRVDLDALLAQVQTCTALLGAVEPAWQTRLARLAIYLEKGARALHHDTVVTLHGDLHGGNILVDGDAITFIDLDGVRQGPATLELGAWVADAMYRAVLDHQTPQSAAPAWRAFLAGYAQASGRAIDMSLLAWATTYDLVCKRAYRCVANLKPGRFAAVPQLLTLADAMARARSVGSHPSTVTAVA